MKGLDSVLSLFVWNFTWMGFNLFLALIAYSISELAFKNPNNIVIKNKFLRPLILFIFIIFLPNTPYLITDLIHIEMQMNKYGADNIFFTLIIIPQFLLLATAGAVLYVKSMRNFITLLGRSLTKAKLIIVRLAFPLLFGYGIVLGRVYRLNSWHVISEPHDLFISVFRSLTTPKYMFLSLCIGLFLIFIYEISSQQSLHSKAQP